MKRKASAEWKGGIIDGRGSITTDSGVLSNTQYSFATRFQNGVGTNPEELIAAAHAGCFSMALSGILGAAKLTAESINTTATVTIEKQGEGFSITAVHLDVKAKIPGHPLKLSIWQLKKLKRDVRYRKYLIPASLWMLCLRPDKFDVRNYYGCFFVLR